MRTIRPGEHEELRILIIEKRRTRWHGAMVVDFSGSMAEWWASLASEGIAIVEAPMPDVVVLGGHPVRTSTLYCDGAFIVGSDTALVTSMHTSAVVAPLSYDLVGGFA